MKNENHNIIYNKILEGRERTNLLKKPEQIAISFFVARMPNWVTSNMLTAVGFTGNLLVTTSFIVAYKFGVIWLLCGIFGLFVNWFGDSLDGRLAYYRNKPRKWYGFTLDITFDWLGILFVGYGFIVYAPQGWEFLGYFFVVLYGWAMVIALLNYKITDKYSIDSGWFSPTEVRLVIGLILLLEVLMPTSIIYTAAISCTILAITNILDSRKLLRAADEKDKENAQKK